jgi:hypothetical protein
MHSDWCCECAANTVNVSERSIMLPGHSKTSLEATTSRWPKTCTVDKLCYLGLQIFVITNFNTIVLTFSIGTDELGWEQVTWYLAPAPSCRSPSPQQSSVLHFNETDCFCALRRKGLLQSLNVCNAYKKCLYLIKNKLSGSFMLSEVTLYFYYWYFVSSQNEVRILHWKRFPICLMFYQSQLITNIETLLCWCMCVHVHTHAHTEVLEYNTEPSFKDCRDWCVFADLNRTHSEYAHSKALISHPLPPSESSRSHIKPQTHCPITAMITVSLEAEEAACGCPN